MPRFPTCLALLAGLLAAREAGAAPGEPLVLAEFQAWHGLASHAAAFSGFPWLAPRAYDSSDPVVIARQIAAAKAMGIDGFVIDWYGGAAAGASNDADRRFMNEVTAKVIAEAEVQGFRIALLYDEGALKGLCDPPCPKRYAEQARLDLAEAAPYLSSPAYLRIAGRPAFFFFAYDDVDGALDWPALRAALGVPVTLLDRDPDDIEPCQGQDGRFDGFYSWVSTEWGGTGHSWGEDYLHWFYSHMRAAPCAGKVMVGGVWPGFDDSLAGWGQQRFIARRGDFVWNATWDLAAAYDAGIVMIATWNDFEEGTDVEFGVGMTVTIDAGTPEVLMRSTPFAVTWDPARGPGVVQLYHRGLVVYEERLAPGALLKGLMPGEPYEVKLWTDGNPVPFSQAVKVRAEDGDLIPPPVPFP